MNIFKRLTTKEPIVKADDCLPSIGEYETGHPITVDPLNLGHWLIGGETGGGKSSYINSLLYTLKTHDITFYGVDCKAGLELSPWADMFEDVAESQPQANIVIADVVKVMQDRFKVMKSLDGNVRKWPWKDRIVLVIDEITECLEVDSDLDLKEGKAEAKARLAGISKIARLGRAAGVHLICATQQPLSTIISSEVKNNLTVRVCTQVQSSAALGVVLGQGFVDEFGPRNIPPYPGVALIRGLPSCPKRPRLGKAYWIEDDELG